MAASQLFLVLATFAVLAGASRHRVYSGYSVHGVEASTRAELGLLHSLGDSHGAEVMVASEGPVFVLLPPGQRAAFLEALDENGLVHYLHEADVAEALEQYDAELAQYRSARKGRLVPFEDFPRYDEVDAYLEQLAATYPDLATLVTAGLSYEGRPIKYLKISSSNFTDASKPVYMLDATIHAREWVTTPVALFAAHRLLEERLPQDEDLIRDIDWIILPIVNPDGYEYTHTHERLWRGTRSVDPSVDTTCVGVDANRNFDVSFNTLGVSGNPCALTWPGSQAFSEPETRIVRDLLHEHLDRIQLYLNIHSYGNWVLFGYGDASLPSNAVAVHHVGAALGAAIDAHKLPQALHYSVGNSASLLYPTSGSAQDYAQSIGVPFSYTLELPAYSYWFEVPPTYIPQIVNETWQGLAASARLAKLHYDARFQG